MRALVTGGTGHIGNVLIRELVKNGVEVKALILKGEDITPIEGLPVEIVYGDIRNYQDVEEAVKGVDVVFHLASVITILPGRNKFIWDVNVGGTRNLLKASIRAGVKRFIHTGSVHAFVEPPMWREINEYTPIDPKKVYGIYAKTKAQAVLDVLKAVKENSLDAVVVCPAGVIGPYDYKLSEMGNFFLSLLKDEMIAYVDGAYNFVDVRDVVDGMIKALELGRTGEIYILAGENISVSEIIEIVKKAKGIRGPKYKLPYWLALSIAPFADIYYLLSKKKPLFTLYSVKTLRANSHISSRKAQRELGYNPRPLEISIIDAVNWLEKHFFPTSQRISAPKKRFVPKKEFLLL